MHRFIPVIAALALSGSCGHPPHEVAHAGRVAAVPVRTARAVEAAQSIGEEVVGTVRARNEAALSASVQGRVREVRVTLGSHVDAGDVLVQLSAAEIGAQVNRARAVYAQAELTRNRMSLLTTSHAVAQAQVDDAAAQFAVAEAALAEAEVMRGYTVLRAPFAGVITAKNCEVGDLATPGRTLLAIASPGAMRFEAFVPETLVAGVAVGGRFPVRVDALGRTLEGTVTEVGPSADAQSRSVLVKLDLPEEGGLHAGMFGRVSVRTGEERTVTIPSEALVRRGQIETVFVASGDHARLRIVRTGRRNDGRLEALSGLRDGEQVVVSHPERLADGQLIAVQP